jgi:hypothetical protein
MAFLDWINNRNAPPQPPVAQTPQPEAPAQRAVESLPGNVKSQAVETARPAAELMEKGTAPKEVSPRPPAPTQPARGRALGMER